MSIVFAKKDKKCRDKRSLAQFKKAKIKKVLEIRPLEALPYVYYKIIGGDKRSSRLTVVIIP